MNPLEQAKASIRSKLGLNNIPSSWSYNERLAYNSALATYIANNADSFDSSTVAIANSNLNQNNSALVDNGFLSSLSVFGDAIGDEVVNAGESVAGIGNGFLTLAGWGKWLIPAVGLSIVGILLYKLYKK